VENANNRIRAEKLEFFKQIEMVSKFTRNSKKNLVKLVSRRKLTRGEFLYKEGDPVEKVFFVIAGEFKITKAVSLLAKKDEQRLKID